MVLPSEEELKLWEIIENGTEEEKTQARKELDELIKREMEEEKKNPPPWAGIIEF